MSSDRPLPRLLGGVGAIAATYVHFLLFAQFGFVDGLRDVGLGPAVIQEAMAAMGFAGLAGSVGTAFLLKRVQAIRAVRGGLLAAAIVAVASLAVGGRGAALAVAAAVGLATALLTVSLAASLRDLLPARRFGTAIGVGTGVAYFACNLPPLFEGPPAVRALVPAALAAVAAVALPRPSGERPRLAGIAAADLTPRGLALVTATFLALIWMDSAAFALIQIQPTLKAVTWGEGWAKPALGLVHLAAAVAAGALLDRGRFWSLPVGAYVTFGVAFPLLAAGGGRAAGAIYATGISIYSVALVAFPAGRGEGEGRVPVRWRAAALFGIAGWIGSALGVGMAQDLHRIPGALLAGLGVVVAGAAALRGGSLARGLLRTVGPAVGIAALVVAAGVAAERGPGAPTAAAAPPSGEATAAPAAVLRGRRVYVAEGCVNCHSQYVRPVATDVLRWGPALPLDRRDRPVLIGNRRQGPDLATVGLRRSPTWQRLHLLQPASLSPGSPMPSYAHLFAGDGSRGADLVAYLGSLGRGAEAERAALVATAPVPVSGSAARGAPLFARHCSVCHGPAGRGDGPLAGVLGRPAALVLADARFLHSSPGEDRIAGLARIVRYGVAGTDMAGHESLSDRQVGDLAAFVASLAEAARPAGGSPGT